MTSYSSGEFCPARGVLKLAGVLSCCWLAVACSRNEQTAGTVEPSAAPVLPVDAASPPFTEVKIPALKYATGDVLDPLPEDALYPSNDPKNFEGIWATIGGTFGIDENGQPLPYLPEVRAEQQRRMQAELSGKPRVRKGTLCRAGGFIGVDGNQFPTQIIQRHEKILFVAEEGRAIHAVYMNAEHPKDLQPSSLGHSIGRWEGNALVIETVGFKDKRAGGGGIADIRGVSGEGRVTTRMTRASTGDKRNGDRLIVRRTIEDPKQYERPWTQVSVGRWRPDLEMLEFNCEESTPALTAEGLIVE